MTLYIAYLRVSTDKQGQSGLGLEAQQAAVRQFVRADDAILETYIEVESGKVNARPQLAAALDACRRNGATLCVANLSRLSRSLHFISGMMESGVAFVACDMPHAREFELHIHAALAQHERRLVSERTKAALAAARARGVVLGGFRGRHLTEAERDAGRAKANAARSRAARVQAVSLKPIMDEIRAAGATTLRDLASALNVRGVPAPRGGTWAPAQVRRVMLAAVA